MEEGTIKKYQEFITIINNGIDYFLSYLNPDIDIPKLKGEINNDLNVSLLLTPGKQWKDLAKLSGSFKPGVYIIFGKENGKEDSYAIYIGKSNHVIKRLREHAGNGEYKMRNFRLDFISCIIPVSKSNPKDELHFLIPALELSLIFYVQPRGIKILNKHGRLQE